MTMTRDDVLTLARLAQLELDEAGIQNMTRELDAILAYIDQLSSLDTEGVEPTAQVSVAEAPLRSDEVRPGVDKRVALSEAPRSDDVGFLVPGFVDES